MAYPPKVSEGHLRNINSQLEEYFDGFVICGYTAGERKRVVVVNQGPDGSTADALQGISMLASQWGARPQPGDPGEVPGG